MLFIKILTKPSFTSKLISYNFGVMDKIHQNRKQKAIDQFQKKMAFLANKPTYTFLDLKQTVVEELSRSQTIRGKLSKQSADSASKLQSDIKVLNALFDKQLTNNKLLTSIQMNEVALTTGLALQRVEQLNKYFSHMKKMHLYLRTLKDNGMPLPKDAKEMRAGLIEHAAKLRDEDEKGIGRSRKQHSRRAITRHIKFRKQR